MIQPDYLAAIREGRINRIDWHAFSLGKISSSDIRALADAMTHNPHIEAINLGEALMGQQTILELARGLEHNTALKSLNLPNSPVGDEGAKALAAVLRDKKELREVNLGQCRIGDEGLAALAEALATCPKLRHLNLRDNQTGEKSAAALGTMLSKLRWLEKFDLRDSGLKVEWLPPVAQALPHCRALVEFDVGGRPDMTSNGSKIVQEAILSGGGSQNLIYANPGGLTVSDYTKANRQRALRANEEIENCDGDFASLSATEIGHAADLLPAIRKATGALHNPQKAPHVDKFAAYLDTLPTVDLTQPVTAEALSHKDDAGRCPLDNPRTWQQFDQLLEQADGSVNFDLLTQKNRDGESFLTIGLATAPDIVIPALNGRGHQLSPEQLLNGHTPSAALEAIMFRNATNRLFTRENWLGQPVRAMQQVFQAMPEEQRALVKNYYSLASAIGSQQGTGTGRGR